MENNYVKVKALLESQVKRIAGLTAVFMLLALFFPPVQLSNAEARDFGNIGNNLPPGLELSPGLGDADGTLTTNAIQNSLLKGLSARYINRGEINIRTALENLALNNLTVVGLGYGYNSVVVGIVSDDYNPLSNLNIIFNPYNERVGYMETHVTSTSEGYIKALHFINGRLFYTNETDIQFISNEAFLEELNLYLSGEEINYSPTNAACVAAVTRFSKAFAKKITIVCLAPCATIWFVPSAVLCGVCVTGLASLGVGTVTAVVNCFRR